MTVTFPYTFKDGEIADGVQVMANLNALKATLEAGGYGASTVLSKYVEGEETRTEEGGKKVTEYWTMPTNDEVTILMPSEGLICVAYQAIWVSSVEGAASAAIFLGENQVSMSAGSARPGQSAVLGKKGEASLFSTQYGLDTTETNSFVGDTTTGQIVGGSVGVGAVMAGGPTSIFAAASSYKVSIRFKASSGTLKVKKRRLWVWVA